MDNVAIPSNFLNTAASTRNASCGYNKTHCGLSMYLNSVVVLHSRSMIFLEKYVEQSLSSETLFVEINRKILQSAFKSTITLRIST